MVWSSGWRRRAAFAAGLGGRDWFALLEAWARLVAVSLTLDRRVGAVLQPATDTDLAGFQEASPDRATAERLHHLVAAAARFHVMRPRCLARAVVLRDMLARRGISSWIRIGVVHDRAGVSAHAWLEGQAGPVGEHPESLQRFSPLEASQPPTVRVTHL